MKKPKTNELEQDAGETRRVRAAMKKSQGIKITINIDADSLAQLRKLSEQTGMPYQRLLNKYLKEGLDKSSSMESRLETLEKELERLKKKVAA
jgi:predicted DNA binding CopG/RHH family protein